MQFKSVVKIVAITFISAGLALGASLASASAAGQGEGSTAEPVAGATLWNLDAAQHAAVEASATQVRERIAAAREARAAGRPDDATASLEQARTMLEGVLDASPAVRAKSRIWVAQNVVPHESSENVLEYLGTIDDELAAMERYAAVDPAKQQLAKAAEHLKKGEPTEAAGALQAANEAVALGAAETPAAETFYLVNIALAAIAQSDDAVAEEVLEAAQRSADAFAAAVPPAIQQVSAAPVAAPPLHAN